MSIENLTEKTFDEKVKKGKVLVDCYADWCGPCQMMSPIIDEVAEENDDWQVYKLDTDAEQEIMEKYEIMSIPTLLIFKDGELIDTLVGFKPKAELLKALKNVE
ncbi:thioredoxin [Candidatus Saccharibacteria bacterium]|nr:thioredoxin [Candidatus Saccharibacteria bacterium]